MHLYNMIYTEKIVDLLENSFHLEIAIKFYK